MNIAVFGMQWGDEGKGKIVDFLAEKADIVTRFQGGNNAGHTVVVGEETFKLHLIPSGVAHNKELLIGNGVVIDPESLMKELDSLKKRGITPNLKISERAHIIMPYHLLLDGASDSHQGKMSAGSTRRGIAPSYADKYARNGLRIADLLELYSNGTLKDYVHKMVSMHSKTLTHIYEVEHDLTEEAIYEKLMSYIDFFKEFATDVSSYIYEAIASGKSVLFEGAQGGLLDIDHGLYPYTTSSNTTLGGLFTGLGLGLHCKNVPTVDKVIGVVKAYTSRVGKGPIPAELTCGIGDHIREIGHEYGTTTGRPRRIAWLDTVEVNQFVKVNGVHELALTKLDTLTGLKELKICTAYQIDGNTVTNRLPTGSQMERCTPIYETFPGWDKDITSCTRFEDLPETAKAYIKRIEALTQVPVTIIGVGPKRSETIFRNK